jgi:hypothetical protein
MAWRINKWHFLTAIGVVLLAMVGAVVWMLVPVPLSGRMPDPNGYDDLIAASRMITGETVAPNSSDYSAVDTQTLRAFVDPNRQALERARVGLGRECRVRLPVTYMDPDWMENAGRFRNLGRLMACECSLDERAGDIPRAADDALDIIRLGRDVGQGGVILDYLVGLAIESLGMSELSRLVPMLSVADARRLSAELSVLDGEHQSHEQVVVQDKAYARSSGEIRVRALFVLAPAFVNKMNAPAVASLAQADRRVAAYRRLLLVKLALRSYRLDHPDAPVPPDLHALVPVDLAAIPNDPFGKGPIKLRVAKDGKSAHGYSVGPDGKDNGGAPVPLKTLLQSGATGDLTLDLP